MTTDFQTHLEKQHARLGDFIVLLDREQSILTAAPVAIDALSDITENKRKLAAELEQLEAQRQQRVIAHGEAADRAGAQALSERLGCSDLWRDFIALVDQASTQNRLNGLHIGTRLDHTQRTLGFLRQISAQSLYSADGQRAPSSGQRISSGA